MEDSENKLNEGCAPAEENEAEAGEFPAQGLGLGSAIGQRLKAYYDDVASEPVPDRFLSLLDALDKAESGSAKKERG